VKVRQVRQVFFYLRVTAAELRRVGLGGVDVREERLLFALQLVDLVK
jgi:hypothetical protein